MRTITPAILSLGFVCAMAIGTPVSTKADEVCIGVCVLDTDASGDYAYREYRYPHERRYYRDYDSYDSYRNERAYQRWTYYEFYFDKWNGSATQYKTFNRGYDVR